MGNNTSGTPLPTMGEDIGDIFDSYNTELYTTPTGEQVPIDNYPTEVLDGLSRNIGAWIEYGGSSPTWYMKSEELKYVQEHLEPTNNTMIRVEEQRFFNRLGYNVGDTLIDPAEFRSYSRTPEATLEFLNRNYSEDKYITIFRTHGSVDQFNATRWNNKYSWEEESFVQQNKMKITSITHLDGEERISFLKEFIGSDTIDTSNIPKDIVFVDVEQA